MRLGFEKIVDENNIDIDGLPRDLRISIKELSDLKARVLAKTNIGQNISEETIERIRIKDQVIIRELLEYIEDEEEDTNDDITYSNDEDDTEDNEDNDDNMQVDYSVAIAIDKELDAMFKSGITTISLGQLKSKARNTYNLLWETYESDEENGIATSNYELIETSENSEEFNLSEL